jgi:hypothetical protein
LEKEKKTSKDLAIKHESFTCVELVEIIFFAAYKGRVILKK